MLQLPCVALFAGCHGSVLVHLSLYAPAEEQPHSSITPGRAQGFDGDLPPLREGKGLATFVQDHPPLSHGRPMLSPSSIASLMTSLPPSCSLSSLASLPKGLP